jgi:hypothetical protein
VRRAAACIAAGLAVLAGCDRGHPAAAPASPASATPAAPSPVPPGATPPASRTTPVGPGPTPTESVATGSVTPTPTGTPLRLTDDQAATLLITPADLPVPYQVDPFVSPDAEVGVPPGCGTLDALGRALGGAPVRAARGFIGGPAGPFLEERVAVLPGAAGDAAAQLTRVAAACRTFDSRDSDGVTVHFSVAPLVLGADDRPGGQQVAADQVVAVAMTGRPAQAGLLVTEVAAVRRGDVVVAFVHSGLDPLDPTVLPAALARAERTLDAF